MDRLFVPSLGPSDWRRLLADPSLHWVPGRSAFECAVAWEAARSEPDGLPRRLRTLLATHPATAGAELVLGLPELKVPLAGGGHPSQTDLWALLGAESGFVSAAVEAKAGEPFGETVLAWMVGTRPSTGRSERLAELMEELGLQLGGAELLRYQLLHRAVSAIKMARRFRAQAAALIVHSFGRMRDDPSFDDFQLLGEALGATVRRGRLIACEGRTSVPLLLGWVDDVPADETTLRAGLEANGERRLRGARARPDEPEREASRPALLPKDLVDGLIALGQPNEEAGPTTREELPAQDVRELLVSDDEWEDVGQSLAVEDLGALIRGLVRHARVTGEHGGSVSPVIVLFRVFARRAPAQEVELADWIYANRVNRYEPFGTPAVERARTWADAREERLAQARERAIAEHEQRSNRLGR